MKNEFVRPRGRPRKNTDGNEHTYRHQVRLNRRQSDFVTTCVKQGLATTKAGVCLKALKILERTLDKRILIIDPTGQSPPEVVLIV